LNRNFGYVWGNNGASNSPSSSIYHGPYAWSEQETVYARDVIYAHKFYAGITYHSYGEWVLYPLGHLPGACSLDHEIMDDLAVEMAETIPSINGTGHYTPIQAVDFGYTCQGTMGDWGYAEQRIFSYTIELATTFIPPESQVEQICEDNLQAALIMLDRVNHSTVTGNITNENDEPLIAEIYVTEIDSVGGMTEVEPVRSDSTFGRYYRLLLPGDYTFTFHHEDYADIRHYDVQVYEAANTNLDICLKPEFIKNTDIEIYTNNDSLYLDWDDEVDYDYEIYSSANPYDNFVINTDGEFIEDSLWRENISGNKRFDKQFYMIKRIAE